MRKILLLLLGFVFSIIIFAGSLSVAFGEMMSNVGVASGDVFRYSYTSYFNANNPYDLPSADLFWINQTDYFMINVTGVSGYSVNFDTMLQGLNGSRYLGVCSMDLGTGLASLSGYIGPPSAGDFYFMAPNVGMMGKMFPSSLVSPIINDTLMVPYAAGTRITNHFATDENNTTIGVYNKLDIYYDQATGMMVQWRQETLQTNGTVQTNSTQIMKITSSNVWTIPEFPLSNILLTLAVVGSVSVLVALIITKKRQQQNLTSINVIHSASVYA